MGPPRFKQILQQHCANPDSNRHAVSSADGCPFAPKATGNIPMDDLVFMLEGMGIATGVNFDKLVETSGWFEGLLEHALPAMLPKAGPCWTSPPPLA
jgi:hypothetical protein